MKRLRLLALVLLWPISSLAQTTGQELLDSCEQRLTSESDRFACVMGIKKWDTRGGRVPAEAHARLTGEEKFICTPSSVGTEELIEAWMEWATAHSERLDEPTFVLMESVHLEKWPCEE